VRRLLVFVVLLVSLAFQGAGLAVQWDLGTGHGSHDHDHAALHLQDVAHHHHGDGAGDANEIVVDNSQESVSHLASDGALNAAALPIYAPLFFAGIPSTSPPDALHPLPSGPDLQGLRRPPRHIL
jgi:hypothetical protein